MAEKEIDGRLTDYFVTETTIDPHVPLEVVNAFLKERKTTGKVTTELNMSQGGSQSIKVTERTKLTDAQADQIREILGMA